MSLIPPELRTLTVGQNRIEFQAFSGEVITDRKWSETHVHSSGGGGYLGSHGGYIRPPSISSTVVTRSQFWLRDNAGREISVSGSDLDFEVRPGHRVTAVCGYTEASERGTYVFLLNHDTGLHVRLRSGIVSLIRALPKERKGCLMAVAALGAILLISAVFGSAALWLIPVAGVGYLFKEGSRMKAEYGAFDAHIQQIGARLRG